MAIAAAGLVSSCSTLASEVSAQQVAQRFVALAAADPARACSMLAPVTREETESTSPTGDCASALSQAWRDDPPRGLVASEVEVAGHSAWTDFGDHVVVLAWFSDGWRVLAAACRPTSADSAIPYDCAISGR